MNVIRGERPLRKVISRRAELRLRFLAEVCPAQTRRILKNLLFLHDAGRPIQKISVADELYSPRNRRLLDCLAANFYGLEERISAEGTVDLASGAKHGKLGYEDLTAGFDEYQLIAELRPTYQGQNRRMIEADREINDLTLYYVNWKLRVFLYKIGEQKSAARGEGNEVAELEARAKMVRVADYLQELATDYPVLSDGIREKISRAAEQLRGFNNPAADAALVPVTLYLEKRIEEQETKRIRKERASGIARPQNILEEELLRLAERRYKASFSPNGAWILPQGGFRGAGAVMRKSIIDHHIPEEKVVRREQHRIDRITRQIAINAHHISVFGTMAELLATGEEPVYQKAASSLARGYLAYEKGIVRAKFKAKLMLKLALELVGNARICRAPKARLRLGQFAAAMLRMVARELVGLNAELGRQLQKITAKQGLVVKIITRQLARDANIRSFSETLLEALSDKKAMNSILMATELRQMAFDLIAAPGMEEGAPPGIRRVRERAGQLADIFTQVGGLIQEKNGYRESFSRTRDRFQCEYHILAASGQEEKIGPLRIQAVAMGGKDIKNISICNQKINAALVEAAKQAILMQHDLATKFQDESAEAQLIFLAEQRSIISQVEALDAGYQKVFGAHGEDLGDACSFDIGELKLKTDRPIRRAV